MYKNISPGLVVMGEVSRPRGLGFKSLHYLLDGHFSDKLKNCNFCLKRPKIKNKRGRE